MFSEGPCRPGKCTLLLRRSHRPETYRQFGIQHYPHWRPRTAAIARSTSRGFMPAVRACLRALRISRSNCFMEGTVSVFRITTSPSPTTTNCDPADRFMRFRSSSGMTTCPFDDIFVVATAIITHSNRYLTSKTNAAGRILQDRKAKVCAERASLCDFSASCTFCNITTRYCTISAYRANRGIGPYLSSFSTHKAAKAPGFQKMFYHEEHEVHEDDEYFPGSLCLCTFVRNIFMNSPFLALFNRE